MHGFFLAHIKSPWNRPVLKGNLLSSVCIFPKLLFSRGQLSSVSGWAEGEIWLLIDMMFQNQLQSETGARQWKSEGQHFRVRKTWA